MANILYLKLQQAKKEYQTYSSKMFDSFSNSNIDKNLSKKISAVSYWLEILETKIKDCSQSSNQDPTPVIFYLNQNCNLELYSNVVYSYMYIRNKNNTFVPIAKVKSSVYNIDSEFSTPVAICLSWLEMEYDAGNSYSSLYNNRDSGIKAEFSSNSCQEGTHKITVTFSNVGDTYNGQSIQCTGQGLTLSENTVSGGISTYNCPEITNEEFNYYDNILNLISIELKFNYSTSEIEPTQYQNVITGDSSTLTLESGDALEL
tara:strand:+ start:6585 stop:7364 length:780 start_codon:yes stop_codon:yes gene_type:complete